MKNFGLLIAGVIILTLSSCSGRVSFTPSPFSPIRTSVNIDTKDVARAAGIYHVYVGKSIGSSIADLKVEFWLNDNSVSGEYTINRIWKGLVRGQVVDGEVTLEVIRNNDCRWTFTGILTENYIQGNGRPDYCPGGQSFEWDLRRT